MENIEVKELLKKYREGKASQQEKNLLERWYLERNTEAINELTEAEFSEDLAIISQGLPLYKPVRKLIWLPRIAAAVAVLAIFFTIFINWPFIEKQLHPVHFTAMKAPDNQRKKILLADGSMIWINVGSVLTYPQTFLAKTREVYLSGEAYFDIRHDPNKPFIIHTGNIITTVLGTAFNIKEDKSQNSVLVTVTRGKVSVANGTHTLGILTPNQQISFNLESHKTTRHLVDAEKVIAWKKIDLLFNDITFEEAARKLEQRFNVKIKFSNDKLRNCRFTGASLTGEKLDKILKVVCAFNKATYQTKHDGSILIDGNGCDQ